MMLYISPKQKLPLLVWLGSTVAAATAATAAAAAGTLAHSHGVPPVAARGTAVGVGAHQREAALPSDPAGER